MVDVEAIVVRLVGWPRTMSVNAKGSRRGNTYVCCSYGFHQLGGLVKRKEEGGGVPSSSLLYFVVCCCLVSAVTYSPTTSRLQYHQRVQA